MEENGLSVPNYPELMDNSTIWEENYRQRVRKMTRDYVNPNSTRLSHRRSNSADSRPQYGNSRMIRETPTVSSSEVFHHRNQGINIFYPTLDESRARVVYDASGPQFPSQLPKPVSFDQAYFERTGRSLSPQHSRGREIRNYGSRMYQMPAGLVDPFESSAGRVLPQSVNPKLAITPKRHDYEFLKDSLIMFGDETSSMGTGASQQELLQHKRKELTINRNEKKERKRILTLPSNLFPAQTNRKQPQNLKRDRNTEKPQEDRSLDKETSLLTEQYMPPPPRVHNQINARSAGSFDERDSMRRVMNEELSSPTMRPQTTYSPRTPGPSTGSFDEKDMRRRVVSPDPPANHQAAPHDRDNSNSMLINRMSNPPSSTGRRWKIIPSLSKSRSRSRSPVRHTISNEDRAGAFPSPTRSVGSGRQDDTNLKPTDTAFYKEGDSGDDGSTDYKLDQRRPLDPPSRMIKINKYDSIDEESTQWDNDFENQTDDDIAKRESFNRKVDNDVYGQTEWDSPFFPDTCSSENGYAADRYESNLRAKYGFIRADVTPRTRSDGAFPDFSTPTTPLTASMTSESSELPSDFDPFTSKLSDSEDPVYGKDFPSSLLSQGPRPVDGRRSIDQVLPAMAFETKARSTYTTMSRLNNPPGLDMDAYAPPKPDAPATTLVTPNAGKTQSQRSSKVSPTSIMDLQNPNVRWSDNLEQLPTPRREIFARPKSILKTNRMQQGVEANDEFLSNETQFQPKAVRISEKPSSKGRFISEQPSALGFLDDDGHVLSPITSFDGDGGDPDLPVPKSSTMFARNIPEEFQQAFGYKNLATSGYASAAYSDFIEAVASVVIQTTVRQFLAKAKLKRLRQERENWRKLHQHRWAQKAAADGKRHVQFNISTRHSTSQRVDKHYLAAIRIQSMFRGWYARDCMAIDNYCATIIQTAFRTFRAWKEYRMDRNRVIKIQALARRKKAYDVFATCMYCVVAIQSAFRGYEVRKRMFDDSHVPPNYIQHVAATIIQTQWRCFRCEMAFLRAYEDILLVQSVARGWVTRRLVRSWLRSHNIKTIHILKENDRRPRGTSSFSYNLPHGYHNHTAFLRQNIPSPLRTIAKQHEQSEVADVTSTSCDPRLHQDKPKSIKEGLLEKYRKKRGHGMHDQTERAHSKASNIQHTASADEPTITQGVKGRILTKDSVSSNTPVETSQYVNNVLTKERLNALPTTTYQNIRKASSDTGVISYHETHRGKFGMGKTKPSFRTIEPALGTKSHLVVSGGTAKDNSNHLGTRGISLNHNFSPRKKAMEQHQRKVSKSLSLDETMKNQQTKPSKDIFDQVREEGTYLASGKISQSRVPHSSSFDIVPRKSAVATLSQKQTLETPLDAAPTIASFTPKEPLIDSTQSSASLILASWRSREKKGGTTLDASNGGMNPDVETTENKQALNPHTSSGVTMLKPVSQGSMVWQKGRTGLSLSKSCDETQDRSKHLGNPVDESHQSSNIQSKFQRKLRPVHSDVQDEKKDDFVRPTALRIITPTASSKKYPPSETGRAAAVLSVSSTADDSGETSSIRNGHVPQLNVTFDPLQSKSPIHLEMRMKRSEIEQKRIDAMHLIFIRSGLIGRHEKEKISFAHTTSAEYEGKMREADDDFEPTAGDLMNAWKECNQTQPTMRGKLF